jgi:hypothetical protein
MLIRSGISSPTAARAGQLVRSHWLSGTVAIALFSVVLRLPFVDTPLTADEGGYAEVARLWAHGQELYRQAWVDRPQGLILVFRGAIAAGLTSAVDLRLVAAGFGALLVVLAGLLAQQVCGRGLCLAALVAVAGASPFLESFTLSGELIASVLATAAILAFVLSVQGDRRGWLVASGLCAGSSWMVKQSAVDAALAVGFCVAFRDGIRLARLGLFIASVATPIAVGALASGDVGAWYDAVVGYGLHASGAGVSVAERWTLFWRSVGPLARALGPTAVLAVIGWRRAPVLARAWLVAAVIGVLLGGGFRTHYYLQLVVPLAFVAVFVPWSRRRTVTGVALAATATLAFAVPLWSSTDDAQARAIWPADTHLQSDSAVADFVRTHTRQSARIYVLWAAADLYYLSERRSTMRYLWIRNVQTIRGSVASVRRSLDRQAAALVVVEQPPASVDPTGATALALYRNYRLDARVDGIDIYRRRP